MPDSPHSPPHPCRPQELEADKHEAKGKGDRHVQERTAKDERGAEGSADSRARRSRPRSIWPGACETGR